ncbi:MAG: FAD-binding protein, partial [bacterium]
MPEVVETLRLLQKIPELRVSRNTPLSLHTRFGIGGPAAIYAETAHMEAFVAARRAAERSALPVVVIGGGTNLIVSDAGFPGVVLRFTASETRLDGGAVFVEAGADLQTLVDRSIDAGLQGVETLTGIPGTVGAA